MKDERLQQIAFSYAPLEDRILMLIKTSDQSEVRAWITRRFLSGLWDMLMKSLKATLQVPAKDERTREAMLAFKHQENIQKSDFSQSYNKETKSTPLGEAPLLLAKARLSPGKNNTQILSLSPSSGKGFTIAVNEQLLHSLCKLLLEAHRKSDWRLPLSIPGDVSFVSSTDQGKFH